MTKKFAIALVLIFIVSLAIGIQVQSKEKQRVGSEKVSNAIIAPANVGNSRTLATTATGKAALRAPGGVGYHDESYFTGPCWCISCSLIDYGYYAPGMSSYGDRAYKNCVPDGYPSYVCEVAVMMYNFDADTTDRFEVNVYWDTDCGNPGGASLLAQYTIAENTPGVQLYPNYVTANVSIDIPTAITYGCWGVEVRPIDYGVCPVFDYHPPDDANSWYYSGGTYYDLGSYFGFTYACWFFRICEQTSVCGPAPTATPQPPSPTPTPDPCLPDQGLSTDDGTWEDALTWIFPDYGGSGGAFFKGLQVPFGSTGAAKLETWMCKVNGYAPSGSVTLRIYKDLDGDGNPCTHDSSICWENTWSPSLDAWPGMTHFVFDIRDAMETCCIDAGDWFVIELTQSNTYAFWAMDLNTNDSGSRGLYYGNGVCYYLYELYTYASFMARLCIYDCAAGPSPTPEPPTPTPAPPTPTPGPGEDEDEDEMDE
jgi:hypothetical protein